MEDLKSIIDLIERKPGSDNLNLYKNKLLKAITYLQLFDVDKQKESLNNELLSKLFALLKVNIKKDLIYCCLIANNDHKVLEYFINYEVNNLELDISDSTSSFMSCYTKKLHWFDIVLRNETTLLAFNEEVIRFIQLIQLIKYTNNEIRSDHIENILEQINVDSFATDKFLKAYLGNMKYIFHILKRLKDTYCWKHKNVTKIFADFSSVSSLDTLSNHFDLSELKIWEEVKDILNLERINLKILYGYEKSEIDEITFTGYNILCRILKCIEICKDSKNTEDISIFVKDCEEKLCNINDPVIQIQLLEDIFVFCFLNSDNLINNNLKDLCSSREILLILMFIKTCLERLRLKKDHLQDQTLCQRLNRLSKFVVDGLWRLEIVEEVKGDAKKNILYYMSAVPESLINLCIKKKQFTRANQVITIFNLSESQLAQEILYTQKLNDLRASLQLAFRYSEFQQKHEINAIHLQTSTPNKILGAFFNQQNDHSQLNDLFDIALTLANNSESTKTIISFIENTGEYNNVFYKELLKIFNQYVPNKDFSFEEIVNSAEYYFNIDECLTSDVHYDELRNMTQLFTDELENKSHGPANIIQMLHKNYNKLNDLAEGNIKYLLRLYTYLKSLIKLCYIDGNHIDIVSKTKAFVTPFDLLTINRSELIGKLIFDKKIDPHDMEYLSGKLKIDLLYHIIYNCFPLIPLNFQKTTSDDNIICKPNSFVLSYTQKRNWLLGFILKELHGTEDKNLLEVNVLRTKHLMQLINSTEICNLKVMYNDNKLLAAFQTNIAEKFLDYFNQFIASENEESDSFETAQEILEDAVRTNWRQLADIFDSIPEILLAREPIVYQMTKDVILNYLVLDGFEKNYYTYVEFIKNDSLRIELILNNYNSWPGAFCIELFRAEISKKLNGIEEKNIEILKYGLRQVSFCEEIKQIFGYRFWYEVHDLCLNETQTILNSILTISKVEILLEFIDLYSADQNLVNKIDTDYFILIFEAKRDVATIKRLFDKILTERMINIIYSLIKTIKNIDQLQFLLDYLLNISENNTRYLRKVQIGLKILNCFTQTEQEQLWILINEPLNILEMLLMNTKLDKLGQVLDVIRPIIITDMQEDLLIEDVDMLLRKYAEKSLDIRVVTQPNAKFLVTHSESKLLESLDSIYGPDCKPFLMPEKVPDKSEWTANDEVLECMCCRNITFSMFNRRHHCRRCGRVICYTCSLKRMQVETYGDIMVRVCVDCCEQTRALDANSSATFSDTISMKSVICDYWLLTDNDVHNTIVRDEFVYEHSPSVSLCLSIMKYHSKSIEYPKFLLNQCENMLALLHPPLKDIHQEIDYSLVIKMLKSLAVAAKMFSAECHLQWGTSLADRLLNQSDLLALLADRGCLHLLAAIERPMRTLSGGGIGLTTNSPSSQISSVNSSGSIVINAAMVRRLRDKLLELEQWDFALEISMKDGLDNAGVFAAWGKSYLKAGCLQLAREKFQRCLDRTGSYFGDFTDHSISIDLESDHQQHDFTTSRRVRYHSRMSSLSDTTAKPQKDHPLLGEIIQILESTTTKLDQRTKRELLQSKLIAESNTSLNKIPGINVQADPAICILNKLKNLQAIAAGNYYNIETEYAQRLDPVFFEECLYYLSRYGSHLSLLTFYVKHSCLNECLHYIIDNHVATDVFIEIYMVCLKRGIINELQEVMSTIDSTLDIWKDYLKHICRHLEKQSMLNCLYQLQQFMGDYIRAAMTCIRFYKQNVKSYKELELNIHFLYNAQEHLKQDDEQEQWVEVNTVRQYSIDSQHSYEEKALTHPSLVMKMDSKTRDKHLTTIARQIDITKFLAQNETDDRKMIDIIKDMTPSLQDETSEPEFSQVPTLFDGQEARMQLAVLTLIYSENIEEGQDIAHKIISDYKLKPLKAYCQAGRQLAKERRYSGIAQLVACVRQHERNRRDTAVTDMCDEMLATVVRTLNAENAALSLIEGLIKLITDRSIKISIYIEMKQLKSAYLLAAKYNRIVDIRRILREAELLNKHDIKKLCQRVLQSHSHSHKES